MFVAKLRNFVTSLTKLLKEYVLINIKVTPSMSNGKAVKRKSASFLKRDDRYSNVWSHLKIS